MVDYVIILRKFSEIIDPIQFSIPGFATVYYYTWLYYLRSQESPRLI